MQSPPIRGPLLSAIAAATRWLDEAHVPSAVIGGIAASLLGRPRVTKDVDVFAVADELSWPELLQSAKAQDIVHRARDVLEFARTTRVLLLRHEPTGVELDVSFAGLPFERELVERATMRTIRGVSFNVEDVAVAEVLTAGRASCAINARKCQRRTRSGQGRKGAAGGLAPDERKVSGRGARLLLAALRCPRSHRSSAVASSWPR